MQAKVQQASALYQIGQLAPAQSLLEAVLKKHPKHYDALQLLSAIAFQTKQYQTALCLLERALKNCPSADAYSNRGIVLHELRQLEAAVASYDQAIALQPDNAEAYSNRGNSLKELGQLEAAVASYDRAIALQPTVATIHYNRGNVLRELGQLEAAVASYDRAIALRPSYAEAYSNRGMVFRELGQLEAAVASYDQAIALRPDVADDYWNKSFALLLGGDLVEGWKLYEWRWAADKMKTQKRNFPQPLWLGKESLAGKTILLHSEQGLGDTIQFCRYAQFVTDLGAQVILEAPKPLVGVLKHLSGVSEVVVEGSPLPAFEYHCPLLSLPLAFKTTVDSIPCPTPYLRAEPGKLAYWTSKLGEKRAPRVGLVWSGRPEHTNDRNRSIGLAALLQHLPARFEYVSLQKEVRDSDRLALESGPHVLHVGNELDDFTNTAALCALMDVIISVDTSVAHLSGALGKPTWVLLPFSPDWRWMLNREDSPWYPSVRLYRQPRVGDWDSVLKNVKVQLTEQDQRGRGDRAAQNW